MSAFNEKDKINGKCDCLRVSVRLWNGKAGWRIAEKEMGIWRTKQTLVLMMRLLMCGCWWWWCRCLTLGTRLVMGLLCCVSKPRETLLCYFWKYRQLFLNAAIWLFLLLFDLMLFKGKTFCSQRLFLEFRKFN